jgi:hypothetical protein
VALSASEVRRREAIGWYLTGLALTVFVGLYYTWVIGVTLFGFGIVILTSRRAWATSPMLLAGIGTPTSIFGCAATLAGHSAGVIAILVGLLLIAVGALPFVIGGRRRHLTRL